MTAGSVGRNAVGTAQAPIGETPQEGLHLVVRLPPEEPLMDIVRFRLTLLDLFLGGLEG